mmetsp:Transcript_20691/g.28644  ORF Transcript_20691/g.28644 Transcript_20691/m.28644 type:complete len:120 (+) Transcript_20691:151-510(+)
MRILLTQVNLKGGVFLEDVYGQKQVADIRAHGFESHAFYGTFLYQDGVASPMVGHLDGHDPKTNDAAFKKYQWSKNHFGDDRWNNAEIDQFSSEDVVKEPLYEFLEGFGDNFQMIRCNT